MNPHEKLAMEFFSPPGPSAKRWRITGMGWHDGATDPWPTWNADNKYQIELKPQTITLPERTIPKPLDVGELVEEDRYYVATNTSITWSHEIAYYPTSHGKLAERGLLYPKTNQGKADAIAAAKGMIGMEDEG